MKKVIFTLLYLGVFLVSACTALPDTKMAKELPTVDAMMKPTPDTMMAKETPTTDGVMKPTSDTMMDKETPATDTIMSPKWLNTGLKDVNSGKTFKISDLKEKVVVVELMATWCPTCLQQQKTIQSFLKEAGMSFEYVSLDIDTNENEMDLGKYAQENQFQWKLAVATRETGHEISQIYGATYINPSSAPLLVVDKKGKVHALPLGLKSAEAFKKALEPFIGM
jgi:thiol-disulfide isomerase/thioredoxin